AINKTGPVKGMCHKSWRARERGRSEFERASERVSSTRSLSPPLPVGDASVCHRKGESMAQLALGTSFSNVVVCRSERLCPRARSGQSQPFESSSDQADRARQCCMQPGGRGE